MNIFGLIGDAIEFFTAGTDNPSIFQHGELSQHREEIQALCGEHGMIEAVRGEPHTFESNGVRFVISDDGVRRIK